MHKVHRHVLAFFKGDGQRLHAAFVYHGHTTLCYKHIGFRKIVVVAKALHAVACQVGAPLKREADGGGHGEAEVHVRGGRLVALGINKYGVGIFLAIVGVQAYGQFYILSAHLRDA